MFMVVVKMEANLREGQSFKAGDVLAADKFFFKQDKASNITEVYKGTLAKVAIMSMDTTYEDSSILTDGFRKKLKSTIVMNSTLSLNSNAILKDIVKIGDQVQTSQPLAIFEEAFNDETGDISRLLESLEDADEELANLASSSKLSKYTGKVVDIRIYYNKEIEEYSDSIQKLIKNYITKYTKRSNKIKGVREDQIIDDRDVGITKSGRAGSNIFDGVLIEFFIEVEDEYKVGDKITFDTALKTITAEILEEDKAPFSEYDKENKVDAILSPLSVISRMTQDVYHLLYGNKVLLELKKQVKDIYEK